jgi:hypothetical protein
VAAHYPVGSNLLSWPGSPESSLRVIPGWDVYLGNGHRQFFRIGSAPDGQAILHLQSETQTRPIRLLSPDIQVEPGQKFTAEALFRKSPEFRGSIALAVSLVRKTNGREERIEHFVLKEPNLIRREGWSAVRETFETPAGTVRLQLRLTGQFLGEVEIGRATLLRR